MLVGREREQRVLAEAVAGARVGTASALVLVGDAGIGKSALLDDAIERAGDMQVLRARGSRPERDVAFAGLLQLVRPALGRLDGLPRPQAEALSVALALREGVVADRFAVGAACLALFAACAEDRALLIVVDDAHLWDGPSAQSVAFAVRRLVADRVAFLAASRPEPETALLASGIAELRLGGLPPTASAELIRRSADHAPAPETMRRLQEACAGNPLALEELARDVAVIERLPPGIPVPVPRALADAFRRRTGGLTAPAREALLLVALVGGDLALAQRVSHHSGCDLGALGEAEAAGLVHIDGGRVHFRHPLVSAGVYADATPGDRRRMHLAVSAALPEQDLERRAWHRAAAATTPDASLAADLLEVGRRAARRGAHAVAVTAFERAGELSGLEGAPGAPSRAECWFAAGEAAWLAGQAAHAEKLLARAADDPRLEHAVSGLRGRIALRAGSLESARSLLWRTAEVAAGNDPADAVLLFAELISACFYLGATDDGMAAASRIEQLLESDLPDSARLPGLMAVGVARVLAGDQGIAQIRAAVTELGSLPAWADDPRRPAWAVMGPLFLRESDSGRELVRHAVDELRARCALGTLPSLLFHTARLDATSRRWQLALSGYDEGARLSRETGQSTDLAMCLAGQAWLEARLGLLGDCRAHAEEAVALATAHHIHQARVWVGHALGDAALGEGALEEARRRYDEVEHVLAEIGLRDVDLSAEPELAEVLGRLGDVDRAADLVRAHRSRAEIKGQPWALARAERACGILADAEHRDEHFRAALAFHASTPDDFETARTQLAYGEALRRDRRRVSAREPLRDAVTTFGALGAARWVDRSIAELEAAGERTQRPGDSPLAILTPQERHIAELLSTGQTTRQAAGALFLSAKTVEYHLRHIYTKLGVRSRAELAEAMTER